jgi:hypothetical protein
MRHGNFHRDRLRIIDLGEIVDGDVGNEIAAPGRASRGVFLIESGIEQDARFLIELRQACIVQMLLRIDIAEARRDFAAVVRAGAG